MTTTILKEPSLDARIWRYIDIEKLVTMLGENMLYFPRADMLGDPWEGSVNAASLDLRERYASQLRAEITSVSSPWHELATLEKWPLSRQYAFVSCWHINESESAAMWALYGRPVAIQSTFAKLKKAMGPQGVHIGMVQYGRPPDAPFDPTDLLGPLFTKRPSFSFEQELRIVSFDDNAFHQKAKAGVGFALRFPFDEVIDAIYVAPDRFPWQRKAIATIAQKFGYTGPVKHSDMDAAPLF